MMNLPSRKLKKGRKQIDFPAFTLEYENACKTEDFNEKWEQSLFRISYVFPRLKIGFQTFQNF